jgi:enamine deaminase RidA (YjgF/YER057c/UK114 family)
VTAPGDIPAQMRQALANLRIALEDAGATMRDVLKTQLVEIEAVAAGA